MPPAFIFFNEILIPLAGMATGLMITLSIIRAASRHLERRHEAALSAGGAKAPEVEGLRAEVRELRGQVEALEERLDFTERLLTQERSRREIGSGGKD